MGCSCGGACLNDPGDEVIAAYDAPFPNAASKAGARAFPLMLPLSPDAPGADAGQQVLDALRADTRPKLFLWADSDPVIPLETGHQFAAALGGQIDHVIAGASHFLQEDAGPEIGESDRVLAGVRSLSPPQKTRPRPAPARRGRPPGPPGRRTSGPCGHRRPRGRSGRR